MAELGPDPSDVVRHEFVTALVVSSSNGTDRGDRLRSSPETGLPRELGGTSVGPEPDPNLSSAKPGEVAEPDFRLQFLSEGTSRLDPAFAFVHVNHMARPGQTRRGRDGQPYPSQAPSDWSRFWVKFRTNGITYKVTLAPPSVWLFQLDQFKKPTAKRAPFAVARFADIMQVMAELQFSEDFVLPAEFDQIDHMSSLVWLGLVQHGRPGDPGFHGGPRWLEDRSFVLVKTTDDGRPYEFRFNCISLKGDDNDGFSVTLRPEWTSTTGKSGLPRPKWTWIRYGHRIEPREQEPTFR